MHALLKKRYGIPAALLVVLLLSATAGTAVAWYSFTTISSKTTVQEPLSTANEEEFSAKMYPGDTKTWSFDIVNSADKPYTVKADLTYDAPEGVSITEFLADGDDKTSDLTSDGTAEFIVAADGTSCSMKITAAEDAELGEVSVTLSLSRAA